MAEAPADILERMELRKRLLNMEAERDASKQQIETVRIDLGHARAQIADMTKLAEAVLDHRSDEGAVGLIKRLADSFAETKRQVISVQEARTLQDQERKQWQRYVERCLSQLGELSPANIEAKTALAAASADHLLKLENERYNVLRSGT